MSFSDDRCTPCTCCCGEYECPYCPKMVFPNSHALVKHLRKSDAHKEQKEAFWCAICKNSFLSISAYIDHLKQKGIHKYDLHQAACCGRFQDVGQLIRTEGADVTGASHKIKPSASPQHLGKTPMHCAAFMGYSRCLKVMLSWPNGNPNTPDDLGQTPVHLAAMCGRGSCLRLLLDKGGDLNILDNNGKSPIQLANNHDDCMNVILLHQLSAMLSQYRVKEMKTQIARSLSFEERRITETNDDSSGSDSSFSETEENSANQEEQSCNDNDEPEVAAVYTAKISNRSRFASILSAFNINSDITSQKIICAEMVVESGHDETSSESNLTTFCAVTRDGDGEHHPVSTNTTVASCQDTEKVYTTGNLVSVSSCLKNDGEARQKLAGTNTIVPKHQDVKNFSTVSSEMLPYEILARGEDGVNAFKTAVADGTARASRLKIMVVGEVGAGKTSLTRSLCGEPFKDTREKTRGIQTASTSDPIIQRTKLDESWEHADPDVSHYDEMIARNVCNKLRQKLQRGNLPGLPSTSGESDLEPLLKRLAVTTFPGLQTPRPDSNNQEHVSHVVTEPCVAIDNTPRKYPASLVAKKLSCATNELSSVKKIIWDFAGHKLYEPMHHVFMNSRSLYLVVFNLVKMEKSPEKCLCKIQYWLNSIASHTPSQTPVVLVGTHKAKVKPEFLEDAKQFCESKFVHMFGERLVRSLENEILFVVENSGGQDDDGILKLKNAIANDVLDPTNFWFVNQDLPLKWLQCEEEIIEHQKNPDCKKCWAKRDVKEFLESKCQTTFTDSDFNAMLTFFHDSGRILLPGVTYGKNEKSIVDDLVVLCPQYLVDVMTRVHEVPSNRSFKRQFSNELQKLKNEGRVACKLLEHVWKDNAEDVDVLIELLSSFNLLHPLHGESKGKLKTATEFIIPCMLKQKSDEHFNTLWLETCQKWNNISDVEHQFVFDFGCFLPPPLFGYFLVHMYRYSCKTKGMNPFLRRHGGIFSISNKFLFFARLVLNDCQIWVRARCKNGEHFLHLARILKEQVTEICQQYFKFLKFVCGPPCPNETCPGTIFNAHDGQRPCEPSSSESEKSSDSDDDDAECLNQDDVDGKSKLDNRTLRRCHVIPMDPDTFDSPYWCGAVDLTEFLRNWDPESLVHNESQGPSEEKADILSQCIEECCITVVSNALGSSWKDLGRKLRLTDTNIENIFNDYPSQKEQGIQVILLWKKNLGSGASVGLLTSALKEISRNDAIDKLHAHCREKCSW